MVFALQVLNYTFFESFGQSKPFFLRKVNNFTEPYYENVSFFDLLNKTNISLKLLLW